MGKWRWASSVGRRSSSLEVFAGDAYLNEMGITNFIFGAENCSSLQGCLLDCNPHQNQPNDMPDPDTGVTDTQKFQDFMRFLDMYPQALQSPDREGLELFTQIGCASCHRPALVTG